MKKGQIKKGFSQFRKVAQEKRGSLRRLRSCNTCEFNTSSTIGEVNCINNNVTSFDMSTAEDGSSCCTFWVLNGVEKDL